MKNLKIHLVVITSLALLVLNACTKDDGPEQGDPGSPIITEFGEPLGQANEVTIGPEGGTINSSDGLLSVSIPQGALSGSTVISIQAITNHAPLGLGNGYRLGPEGLSFENPVTLTIHYNEELLDSKPAEFLWIVFQESDGSWKAMLKSALHSDAKTVTVETSHFSDWSLGRFADLTLNPTTTEVIKGKTVKLAITGFSNLSPTEDDDETGPLIPLEEEERLIFLSKNEFTWRVVEWTLNGVKSPVSNSNGSLNSAEHTASYTAPSNVPKPNVVTVAVELETTAIDDKNSTFILRSDITIIESNLFLMVEFRGQTYIYYQYGANDAVIEDPNNFSMSVCGLSQNRLNVGGQTMVNNEITEAFGFYFDNPFKGSRGMIGSWDNGNDAMGFTIFNPIAHYDISKVTRTPGYNCEEVINESNHVTMTLTNYLGTSLSQVDGSFNGTLYYSDQSYDIDCKSSTPYPVSGSFRLLLHTQ